MLRVGEEVLDDGHDDPQNALAPTRGGQVHAGPTSPSRLDGCCHLEVGNSLGNDGVVGRDWVVRGQQPNGKYTLGSLVVEESGERDG